MPNFRITARHNSEYLDAHSWATRVRDATPAGLEISHAYIDREQLVVYVEAGSQAEDLVAQFADRLGLGWCASRPVDPLPLVATSSTVASSPQLLLVGVRRTDLLEATTVSQDGRVLQLTVRHKPHEQIDHVDVKEKKDAVEITAWVGSPPDDDRRHYATLGEAFSTSTIVLERPLGTRRIVEGH
jgi:hypothetical protein